MPRFFFHIHDGTDLLDHEGTELAGWREAQVEAIRVAGAVIEDSARQIKLGESWWMEVTNDRGHILFKLDFQIVGAPGIPPSQPDHAPE